VTPDTPSANQCARDSFVFAPRDHRAERFLVLLWKKILTWAKPTRRRHLRLRSHSRNEIFIARAVTQHHSRYVPKRPFHMHFRRVDKIRWSASVKQTRARIASHRRYAFASEAGWILCSRPPALMGVDVFFIALV
jgi:hypothetical protein